MSIIKNFLILLIKLFSVFISIILFVLFSFFSYPNIYKGEINQYLEENIKSYVDAEVNLGEIEGNLFDGLNVEKIIIYNNQDTIFLCDSLVVTSKIWNLFLGELYIDSIYIYNALIDFPTDIKYIESFKNNNMNIPIKYFINNLYINQSKIKYETYDFGLSGNFEVNNKEGLFSTLLDSVVLSSKKINNNITVKSGQIDLMLPNINFRHIVWCSNDFNGKIDLSTNLNRLEQANGKLSFNILQYDFKSLGNLKLDSLNLSFKSYNDTLTGHAITNLTYDEHRVKDFSLNYFLKNNHLTLSANNDILDGTIDLKANINLKNNEFSSKFFLKDIIYMDASIKDASIAVEKSNGSNGFDIDLIFNEAKYQNYKFYNISSELNYFDNTYTSNKITIEGEKVTGKFTNVIFENINKYSFIGEFKFNNFNINKLLTNFSFKLPLFKTGYSTFIFSKNGLLANLDAKLNLEQGYMNNFVFNDISSELDLSLKNNIIYGKSNININNSLLYGKDWSLIKLSLDIKNNGNIDIICKGDGGYGDYIDLDAKYNFSNKFQLFDFNGQINQVKFSFKPFGINFTNNTFDLNMLTLNIGDGSLKINGKYINADKFNLTTDIKNIKLNQINSILNVPNRINGTANGSFNISKTKEYPILLGEVYIDSGSIDDIYFNELLFSGSYRNNRTLINKMNLNTDFGFLRTQGWFTGKFDFNSFYSINSGDSINIEVSLDQHSLKDYNRYLPWEYYIDGKVTGNAYISGTAKDPLINTNFNIINPIFDNMNGKSIDGKIIYSNKKLYLKSMLLTTEHGKYTGNGYIPIDLNYKNKYNFLNQEIDFILNGKSKKLEYFSNYYETLDSLNGEISLQIDFSGTLDNPVRGGLISIQDANLYLLPLENPITGINGVAKINNNRLVIEKFTGNMINNNSNILSNNIIANRLNIFKSESKILSDNNIMMTGSIDLSEIFNPDYSLLIKGNNIYLNSSSQYFIGHGDTEININGKDTVFISGNFEPKPYQFTIFDLSGSPDYEDDFESSSTSLVYDIYVPIIDGITMETDNINIAFDGDINISAIGNEDFNYSGKINVIDGQFYDNQGNEFQNTNGTILLSPSDNNPYIDVHAQTNISDELIELTFIGFLNNPSIILETSSEEYSQSDILELLAFRNIELSTNIDGNQRAGDFFSNYLENAIEKNIKKYSVFDEFQLQSSGSIIEGLEDAELNLYLGKRITSKLYINTQFNLDEINKSEYEISYRLNKNMSLVAKLDENDFWHLNYRVKYYYK